MSRVDYVPYPPSSFPFRDLLVLEQLPISPTDRVCEVGVGSGETTARLARLCAEVVGVEISAPAVEALRYLEHRHPNLRFRVADVTEPRSLVGLENHFDRLLSCDTLEHVRDPAAYFEGIAKLLVPGGQFLVTFPNEPSDRMHGITRFDSRDEILALAGRAGLVDVRVSTVHLAPSAERIANVFGFGPVDVVRKLTRRPKSFATESKSAVGKTEATSGGADKAGGEPPQTFDQTHFFRRRKLYQRLSPAVNLYWFAVLRAMSSVGPCFVTDESLTRARFDDSQVMILGRKPATASPRGRA